MRCFGRFSVALFLSLVVAVTAAGGSFDIRYERNSTFVTNRTGGVYDPGQAIAIAIANDLTGIVQISARGEVQLERSVETDRSRFELRIVNGTTLRVSPSGAIGALSLTGDFVRVTGGGRILINEWTDDQVALNLSGRGCSVDDLVFDVGSAGVLTSATTANPMILLKLDTCYEVSVRDCIFLGGKGVTGILGTQGNGLFVESCRFTNEDSDGSGGTGESDTVRRKLYRGIDIQGQEFGHIADCRFWGLGDGTDEVDALILLQRSSTPANTEEGHFVISGCVMESVFAPKAVQLRGSQGVLITGNLWGANAGPNANGEGTIHITGIAGVDSGNSTNIVKASWKGLPAPGKVVILPEGQDMEFPPHNVGASDVADDRKLLAETIAAAVDLPVFVLIPTASDGNYSASIVAESPMVRMFLELQELFRPDIERLIAELTGEEEGFHVDFPPIIRRGFGEQAAGLAVAIQNGFVSKQTAWERIRTGDRPWMGPGGEFERITREAQALAQATGAAMTGFGGHNDAPAPNQKRADGGVGSVPTGTAQGAGAGSEGSPSGGS